MNFYLQLAISAIVYFLLFSSVSLLLFCLLLYKNKLHIRSCTKQLKKGIRYTLLECLHSAKFYKFILRSPLTKKTHRALLFDTQIYMFTFCFLNVPVMNTEDFKRKKCTCIVEKEKWRSMI